MMDEPTSAVEILAPTLFEYLITRSLRPGVPVRHAGMRLSRWHDIDGGASVILCGLAGALRPGLVPGDVVVPDECSFEGEDLITMDPILVAALRNAARSLGYAAYGGQLLTARNLVTGDASCLWAARGFVAADMEAALLPRGLRVAVIRVILDAPGDSISSEWTNPAGAMIDVRRWREMLWMARHAPVLTRRAAKIAALAAQGLLT